MRRILPFLCIGFCLAAACDKSSPTRPTPVCTYSISPATLDFADAGGAGNVTVSTAATCAWTASTNVDWITFAAGGSGTGPGTLAYSVGANAQPDSRAATVMVAGQAHAVSQRGRPATTCTYSLSPTRAEYSKDEADGHVSVRAPAGCAWTAVSDESWLTVTSGRSGSGDGTVSYSVARNTSAIDRSAKIAIADQVFALSQAGDTGICTFSVSPVQFEPCMPAGSVSARVTTAAGCSWTANPDASWLKVSRTSGTGSADLTITFSENYNAPRDGKVLVRWSAPTLGQNLLIDQAGCHYGVSKTSISIGAAGGSGTFDVLQESEPMICGGPLQDACVWSAKPSVSWITITSSMPRQGDNPVAFTVAPNGTGAARTGTITVRDKVVTISQAGS